MSQIVHSKESIEQMLSSMDIEFQSFSHPPVFTTDDVANLPEKIPGVDTKNLFLRDEKKRQYILLCVRAEVRVDLKQLGKDLNLRGLTFASSEDMWSMLKVKPGAVCLFSLVHDTQTCVTAYLDAGISLDDLMQNHPLQNTDTVVLRVGDMVRFCESTGHVVTQLVVPGR